jgi:xylose isomerase
MAPRILWRGVKSSSKTSVRSLRDYSSSCGKNEDLRMKERYLLRDKNGKNGLGAGVWNIGPGNDPFGGPTREAIPILDRLPIIADAGITYFEAHDSEIPITEVEAAKTRADKLGLKCGMYTPSFFADPIFKDGAMTSNDPAIRKTAVENAKRAVDAALGLEAPTLVFWNGREGFDFVLTKNGQDAFKRLVDGFNQVAQYAKERAAGKVRLAVEPKPNEPRANMYLATVGEVLYLISRLDPAHRDLFGVNPETAHSRIAGLDYLWDVELCLEAGKLFHIHLNSQDGQRYDQDLPFGYTEPLKDMALLVVLQDAGYEGVIAFDVKAPRTDSPQNIADILTVSSQNLVWLWEKAWTVDRSILHRFRNENRNTAIAGYLGECLFGH